MSGIIREGDYTFLIGTQGTGKSYLAKQLAQKRERALIIPATRDDSNWDDVQEIDWKSILFKSTGLLEWEINKLYKDQHVKDRIRFYHALGHALNDFTGMRKIFIDNEDERVVFDGIIDKQYGYKRGTIVLDDYKNYIVANNLTGRVKSFITDRRFRMLDIYLMCHGPSFIAPDFFSWNPGVILFGTTENFSRARGKCADSAIDALEAAKQRIDRRYWHGKNNNIPTDKHYCEFVQLFGGHGAQVQEG